MYALKLVCITHINSMHVVTVFVAHYIIRLKVPTQRHSSYQFYFRSNTQFFVGGRNDMWPLAGHTVSAQNPFSPIYSGCQFCFPLGWSRGLTSIRGVGVLTGVLTGDSTSSSSNPAAWLKEAFHHVAVDFLSWMRNMAGMHGHCLNITWQKIKGET